VFSARRMSQYCPVPHGPFQQNERRLTSPSIRASRRTTQAARSALGLALLLAFPSGAQYGPIEPGSQQGAGHQIGGSLSALSDDDPRPEEERLRAMNAARQKSMVSDSNRLLKLAQELNDEVSSTNPDSLTLAELSKIAEIEKLAHKVKGKMSMSVRGATDSQPFLLPPYR